MFWQTKASYEFGPFRVDERERRLLRDGEVVPLTPKVFDILLVFVQNSGHILSKDEVMKLVWPNTAVEEGNLARNVSTLRKALGERPTNYRYVETVPWRGYRFMANVHVVRDEPVRPAIDSIAVLPFVNVAGDPNLEYLSDGISESLINNLSQLPHLKVMSRNSAFRYRGRDTDAQAVGRELNVQAVVMGRVADREDMLSISVELVDARDDRHLWGAQYIRQSADILAMQETIANEITGKLRLKLTSEEQQRLTRRHPEKTDAYHLYLKGRYHFNKLTLDGVEKGITHFQQAIEKAPRYALAYTGLIDCYNYLAKRAEARKAATRALELDQTLGEAHASLAFHKFLYDWNFAGAERGFRQAIELNPNYAEAHHWYAIYLANVGRHDEAVPLGKRAVELDPLSLLMNMTPALIFYLSRQYYRSVEVLQKILEMEPNFPAAHSVLGNAYAQAEMYEHAMAEYQKVLELSQGVTVVETAMKAIIAHAYARWGKRSKAMKMLDEVIKASANGTNVSSYSIAGIYAALGESAPAFEWLDKAYEQHDLQLVSLKVDPSLDGVRSDPRFADLVRRVGLPQ
jgi:TolB-like protein/Tfp pilus assembly protein PilF